MATAATNALKRTEIRLEDGTITELRGGDTWVEFDAPADHHHRSDISSRFLINDVVTDAVQVKLIDEDNEFPLADRPLDEFRKKAASGLIAPESHVFPEPESPTAADIVEDIAEAVNTSVAADELMSEFDSKHNALQQRAFTEVVKPMLLALATTPSVDQRNSHAADSAQEIIDLMGWEIPDHRQ